MYWAVTEIFYLHRHRFSANIELNIAFGGFNQPGTKPVYCFDEPAMSPPNSVK
ncbi:hypothetical protein JCM19240_5367 [Vibrio maritimus]|uniref:Uncharacterized protein n=1 Tax=Vibrio maritimus TaxID=990268 RepID=A0A090SW62_9VIBR|nr:hypothetical protein JCM19240_5367 [Vibrio maritimus]